MTNPKKYNVKIEHTFSSAPGKVYDAWLDPSLARQWFGPGLGETQPVSINPKPGGKFRIVQIRDGNPAGHFGEYLILERPNRIAFSWLTDDEKSYSEVHIHISSNGQGSSVRLVHSIDEEWAGYAESIRNAWGSMMKEMDRLIS